jgi:ABC-type multidrug transport system ATPase subunit/ABC-type multidrug transport system permease subunit
MTKHGSRVLNTRTETSTMPMARASRGLLVEAREAGHTLHDGSEILHPVSLSIRPGTLVAIIGASGAGKTLLLDALAGLALPTDGVVLHDGITCRARDSVGVAEIGYVPQDDIIHRSMPLERTLRYAARLRLPKRASDLEVNQAVTEVMAVLGLTQRAQTKVDLLSGGERKRASIAVELLARPPALFLDEPTSGLDPVMAADLVELLRKIAAAGNTVVFTSHNPRDVVPCGMVVVLADEGHLAYAGPPANALAHFRARSFEDIYERLAQEPDPAAWAARRPADPGAGAASAPSPTAPVPVPEAGLGAVGQWLLLTRRSLDLLARSRLTLAILLGSPVMIVLMFLMMFQPGAFDLSDPSPDTALMILFWIAFGGFFFGLTYGLSQICDEFPILRRERIAGLRIGAYLASKVAILLPVLVIVDALLLATLSGTGRLPALDSAAWLRLLATLVLTSSCALTLGLLASASVSAPAQATMMLPMLCFPQVLFVGAFLPVQVMAWPGRWLSFLMSNRWAFQALGNTAGIEDLWRNGSSPLGAALLESYGNTFSGSLQADWVFLAAFTLVFLAAAGIVLTAKTPRRRRTSR